MTDPRILDPEDFADLESDLLSLDLLSLEVVSTLWLTSPESDQ